MTTRATVRLSTRCDNACRFCAQAGVEARDVADAAWEEALVQARGRGADEVTFVGGEPLLVQGLERAIARARELGFRAIGVQSNGWALGEPRRVEGLRAAGLTDVHLSVHGGRAAVHDYHVGRDGAFERIVVALGELRRCGVVVVVRTVLTRSNARVIGELPAWLGGHGVRAWGIAVPRVAGGAAREFDRVVPRLGVAVPFALHALDRARRIGIAVGVIGAPRCVLGPW
ncbi:MAG: radical SAM protein, partial [Myxococcales bacterium]|nr:radical SAM protein [Myxococcales bacterium]